MVAEHGGAVSSLQHDALCQWHVIVFVVTLELAKVNDVGGPTFIEVELVVALITLPAQAGCGESAIARIGAMAAQSAGLDVVVNKFDVGRVAAGKLVRSEEHTSE